MEQRQEVHETQGHEQAVGQTSKRILPSRFPKLSHNTDYGYCRNGEVDKPSEVLTKQLRGTTRPLKVTFCQTAASTDLPNQFQREKVSRTDHESHGDRIHKRISLRSV